MALRAWMAAAVAAAMMATGLAAPAAADLIYRHRLNGAAPVLTTPAPAAPVAPRFYRLRTLAPSFWSGDGGWSVLYGEVELYAATSATGSNVALGKAAAASVLPGDAAKAVDGANMQQFFVAPHAAPSWLSIDLGAGNPTIVRTIRLWTNDRITQSLMVEASPDGLAWSEVATLATSNPGALGTWYTLPTLPKKAFVDGVLQTVP